MRFFLLSSLVVFSACNGNENALGSTKESPPIVDDTGGTVPTDTGTSVYCPPGNTTEGGQPDNDCDGYGYPDCDDADASIHPGATEVCGDGIDQDCDGADLTVGCPVDTGGGGSDSSPPDTGVEVDFQIPTSPIVVPAEATEANFWLQVECQDVSDCSDLTIMVKSLVVSDESSTLLSTDFTSVTDLTTVEWSGEVALIGADGRGGDPVSLFAPADFFTLSPGEGASFTVPDGQYAGPFSCNINKACSRPVTPGRLITPAGTVICRTDTGQGAVQFRWGSDFLRSRGTGGAPDDFLEAVQGDWTAISAGQWCAEFLPA